MSKYSTQNVGSSQDFVPIKEIKDGVIVLDDGTLVSISMVTSINLSLKSADEQTATIQAFQNFLNLLEFPVQICIQSRKLDISPYIQLLENRMREQTNDLVKIQTIEYISFIKSFTEAINVMDKKFFLVISYKPLLATSSKKGFFSTLFSSSKELSEEEQNAMFFEEAKNQLEQRISLLSSGLAQTGVRVKRIDTEASIELLYSILNPGENKLEMASKDK